MYPRYRGGNSECCRTFPDGRWNVPVYSSVFCFAYNEFVGCTAFSSPQVPCTVRLCWRLLWPSRRHTRITRWPVWRRTRQKTNRARHPSHRYADYGGYVAYNGGVADCWRLQPRLGRWHDHVDDTAVKLRSSGVYVVALLLDNLCACAHEKAFTSTRTE